MARFKRGGSLEDSGRRHLELCRQVAEAPGAHGERMASVMRQVNLSELRRAGRGADAAGQFLYAPLEAAIRGDPVGPYVEYLFFLSIFLVAADNDIGGPLIELSGEEAAQNLQGLLLAALESDDDDFILGGAGETLDRLGNILDEVLYKIQVRIFRMMVALKRRNDSDSDLEILTNTAEAERLRLEIRDLLPVAREQCARSEHKADMLRTFEEMLGLTTTAAADEHVAEAVPPSAPAGAPLDGRELSMVAAAAFQHAVSGLPSGKPLDTLRLFTALEAPDMTSQWERLWLEAGDSRFLASLDLADPEPGAAGTWNGVPLSGTCTRALQIAVLLCDSYDLWPVPVGAVALALVADPESGAARALMAQDSLQHAPLIELLQEITFGRRLTDVHGLIAAAVTGRVESAEPGNVRPADSGKRGEAEIASASVAQTVRPAPTGRSARLSGLVAELRNRPGLAAEDTRPVALEGGALPAHAARSERPSSESALTAVAARERLMALPLNDAGDVAWGALGLLTAAEGPLTMGDVAGILGLPARQVHRAIEPIADLIVRNGRLEVTSDPIRYAVAGYLGQAEQLSHEQALARWCSDLAASGQRDRSLPDYVVRHGAASLAAAGQGQDLDRLVDRAWMGLSVARTGSLATFTNDMLLAARGAAEDPTSRLRELRATLALVTSSAAAARVPPEALGVLALAGQDNRAMDLAAMVTSESRGDGYYRIAVALHGSGNAAAADDAAGKAIGAAASYARESGSHYPLQNLAHSMHESGRSQWALRALASLEAEAPSMPVDYYLAAGILAAAGDIDGAWQAARRMPDSFSRDQALRDIVVAAQARAGRIQDALSACQVMEDPWVVTGEIAGVIAETGDVATAKTMISSVPAHQREWAVAKVLEALVRIRRVEDAQAIAQSTDDPERREHVMRTLATLLAANGEAALALNVLGAAVSGQREDYDAAELVKTAAGAGDLEGALHIAAAIGQDHSFATALTHVAVAAATAGDLGLATAAVRVIGDEAREDRAFAALAGHLVVHDHVDEALEVTGMIRGDRVRVETQVTMANSLAAAGDYLRSASLAEAAADAQATSGSDLHVRALISSAWALGLSGRPREAMTAAERAVSTAEGAPGQELLADALAAWSGTLAASGRQAEASNAATRAMTAIDQEAESYPRRRDHRAKTVALILAETGPPEQAVSLAGSLAGDYERDQALTEVAARLARRGLAGPAIEALRASPYFVSYRARDKVGEVVRILARHGHADGAMQAANAVTDIDALRDLADYDLARLVCDVARVLARNGLAEAALSAVQESRPAWNRPAAFTDIACAVARAGDVGRAAEIARATAGCSALAKVASNLAEAGNVAEALPLAQDAIEMALAAAPEWPATSEALAALQRLAEPPGSDQPAAPALAVAGEPAGDMAALSAIATLADTGQLSEALAGIGALKNDRTKATALRSVAARLAARGQSQELRDLARSTGVLDPIADGERVAALTGIGCALVKAGEASLAANLADEAARCAQEPAGTAVKAAALADMAELRAALGHRPEAADLAGQALAVAGEPIGGWRSYVTTKAVEVLTSCGRLDDATDAARSAPAGSQAKCRAAVVTALYASGEQDRAVTLVSEAFAAVRDTGDRSAFYDLIGTYLPECPGLFQAWLGRDVEFAQVSRDLAEIEKWWDHTRVR